MRRVWPRSAEAGHPSWVALHNEPLRHDFTQFEERQICDHYENCYGWPEDLSNRIDVQAVVDCGFSVAVDQVEADPSYKGWSLSDGSPYDYYTPTMKKAIWSFAEGEPNNWNNLDEDCAEMMWNGRWIDLQCSESRPYACKKIGHTCDPDECDGEFWTLSTSAGIWSGGHGACPLGYEFGVPRNGYENKKLKERANGAAVWLNFHDRRVEGTWEIERYENWSVGEPNDYNGQEDCAEMRSDGLWNDNHCDGVAWRFACRKNDAICGPSSCDGDLWVLSSYGGTWRNSGCPPGYTFAAPRSSAENDKLKQVANGETVWLNYSDGGVEGFWE